MARKRPLKPSDLILTYHAFDLTCTQCGYVIEGHTEVYRADWDPMGRVFVDKDDLRSLMVEHYTQHPDHTDIFNRWTQTPTEESDNIWSLIK